LGNFKDIEQRLRGDALDAIIAKLAPNALQTQTPSIDVRFGYFGLRFLQLT
jgi:hypothetical protein